MHSFPPDSLSISKSISPSTSLVKGKKVVDNKSKGTLDLDALFSTADAASDQNDQILCSSPLAFIPLQDYGNFVGSAPYTEMVSV